MWVGRQNDSIYWTVNQREIAATRTNNKTNTNNSSSNLQLHQTTGKRTNKQTKNGRESKRRVQKDKPLWGSKLAHNEMNVRHGLEQAAAQDWQPIVTACGERLEVKVVQYAAGDTVTAGLTAVHQQQLVGQSKAHYNMCMK